MELQIASTKFARPNLNVQVIFAQFLSFTDPTGEIAVPIVVWGIPIIIGTTWWYTDKRPKFPDWGRDNDPPKGEAWPKENKDFCVRTYANCVNYGWTGNCQTCMDRCISSGSGDWPFNMCKPKKKGDMCEP